jgi:DHA3 family macrolide efflux protein-like MFS transporter
MLVPGEELVRANGWGQFMSSGAFMLGPVLGAALYASLSLPVIMLTDVMGALIACVCVAVIRIPDPLREKQRKLAIFNEMKDGAAVLLRDKRLCIVTLAATFCMVFYLPLSSLYPLMTSEYFSGTAWHASIVEFVYAGGMMLCAAIVSAHGEIKHKFGVIHAALITMGLWTLLCGILPADLSVFWVFVLLCGLMGAGGNLYNIPYIAYLQQTVSPEAQGRVFSLISSLMSLAMPIGLLLAGPFAEAYGVNKLFVLCGAAIMFIMTVSAAIILPLKPGSQQAASKAPDWD